MLELEVFEQIYRDYLKAVAQIDFSAIKDRLGVQVIAGEALIAFYGFEHMPQRPQARRCSRCLQKCL